jgi:hypothetical protein
MTSNQPTGQGDFEYRCTCCLAHWGTSMPTTPLAQLDPDVCHRDPSAAEYLTDSHAMVREVLDYLECADFSADRQASRERGPRTGRAGRSSRSSCAATRSPTRSSRRARETLGCECQRRGPHDRPGRQRGAQQAHRRGGTRFASARASRAPMCPTFRRRTLPELVFASCHPNVDNAAPGRAETPQAPPDWWRFARAGGCRRQRSDDNLSPSVDARSAGTLSHHHGSGRAGAPRWLAWPRVFAASP